MVERKRVTTRILRATVDQVLQAHDLGNRRRHFRREAGRQGRRPLGSGLIGQQPVAKFADGEVRYRREGGGSCESQMRRVTSSSS